MNDPVDIHVFPIGTPNQELTDAKQYLAAQRSLAILKQSIADSESYGPGYLQLLHKRVTETTAIIHKLEEKYKDS